jgi:transposase
MASEQKMGRGRPTKLDASTSARFAALLIAGASVTGAANEVGVSRRTATGWLAQAWSRDPRDAEAVRLVQMIQRGKLAAAEVGQRSARTPGTRLLTLSELLADFAD